MTDPTREEILEIENEKLKEELKTAWLTAKVEAKDRDSYKFKYETLVKAIFPSAKKHLKGKE